MSANSNASLVVHVINRLAVGGLENGLVNLINHLPHERFRHAIVCLTEATDFVERISRRDVPIVELHKGPGNSIAIQHQFFRIFRQLQPSIVHTRNLGSLEAQFSAALAGVSVRIHGEHGWDIMDPDGSNQRRAYIRRLSSPFVHRYVALSGHIESYLRTRVGIAASRIDKICNGVDCERFRPCASRGAFPHPGFRDPALVLIGTVGRLDPVKDQLALARAFVALIKEQSENRRLLRLVIIGAGPLRLQIEQLLASSGVADLAWLPGERSDVPSLLPALDVFVLPSRAEGISNTILEAMACGVPVVATAVGGNSELVSAEETGTLVRPNDVSALAKDIFRLANDRETRAKMGLAARARAVAQFSLAEMVRRYAALYQRELHQRASWGPSSSMRRAPVK
jgi:sugar transferase (PEP-CTERM/EpsH1 system associated)